MQTTANILMYFLLSYYAYPFLPHFHCCDSAHNQMVYSSKTHF